MSLELIRKYGIGGWGYEAGEAAGVEVPVRETAQYTSGLQQVTSGGAASALVWGPTNFGDDLLDLSSPTAPKALVAGDYAVSASVLCRDGTIADKSALVELSLAAFNIGDTGPLIGPGDQYPRVTISQTTRLEAGEPLIVTLLHDAPSGTNWQLATIVQRFGP